jgi:hypothetical protein
MAVASGHLVAEEYRHLRRRMWMSGFAAGPARVLAAQCSLKGVLMSRLMRSSVVLIAGVLGLGGLAAPASADATTVSVSSAPGVLFPECTDHPFSYSVTPPETAIAWSIELVVQAPDGTSGGSLYISKGDPTTGVETETFCPSSSIPGTYGVTGTYKVVDDDPNSSFPKTTITPVAPFTFDLRLAYAKVDARASDKTPRIGQKVRVNVKVSDERPSGGFFATSGAEVKLQRLKGSAWVNVPGGRAYTSSNGRVQVRFRTKARGKTRYRALADVTDIGKVSSSTFTLRTSR